MSINALTIVAATIAWHAQPQDTLGRVHFPNSGAEAAQPAFLQGVRLLHSFEYETAAKAFRQARQIDSAFALAYWGEAMTHFHLLWQEEDVEAARRILRRDEGAVALPTAPTRRERMYLDAAGALAGTGAKTERLAGYADAMRRLVEAYPDDLEARALYALAILATADGERDIPTYMRAAAVAEEVFAEAPEHPGAAHYLIHAYDDPVHAPLGIRAARVYAGIAPGAPHALHMPSHIFLALGDWDRVVASNEASAAAAQAKLAAGNGDGLGARNHAWYWLAYGRLQVGDWEGAHAVVRSLEREADATDNGGTRWHAAMARAAYLVDAPRPDSGMLARAMRVPLDWGGRAGVASRLAADLALGDAASTPLTPADHESPTIRILQMERNALGLEEAGRIDSAVALLRAAAELEASQPIDFGPPLVVKPAAELLGDVLRKAGSDSAAAQAYRRALERTPNRRAAVDGLQAAQGSSGSGQASILSPIEPDTVARSTPVVNRTALGTWVHYVPREARAVLVLAHGYPWPDDSRTAAQLEAHATGYVERWREYAEARGLILLVPAFGSGDFAGYREMFGKRVDPDAFLIGLADGYGEALISGYARRFFLYGHSAGGQFAGRMLVSHPERLAGVVLSAPGTYPFPNGEVAWPYGMAPVTRDTLSGTTATGKPRAAASGATFRPDQDGWTQAARTVPTRIVIGSADTEPQSDKPGHPTTRVDRAIVWARAMNSLPGVDSDRGGVGIRFVPGVGHDPVALTPAAERMLELIAGSERETVLDSVAWLVDDRGEVPNAPRPDAQSRSVERRIRAQGMSFYVREAGSGTPLVLVPGGPGNTQQSFHPYFDRAAEFARVISYDPRGTGDSDWIPGPAGYSADQAVADLDAIRAALGIDRWIVLGWSFGGLLAQRYTLDYGEHVAGLVLLSTSLPMEVDLGEGDERRYLSSVERVRIAEVYRRGVRTVVPVHSDQADLETVRRLVYTAYRNGAWKRQFFFRPSFERMAQVARWEWLHDRNYTRQVNTSGFARDLTGAFRDAAPPTLIVEGRWDPGWGPRKVDVLREQFPRAAVHELDEASHNAFAERPDEFFSVLERFVTTEARP